MLGKLITISPLLLSCCWNCSVVEISPLIIVSYCLAGLIRYFEVSGVNQLIQTNGEACYCSGMICTTIISEAFGCNV